MEAGFSDALLTPLTMGIAFVFFVISVAVFALGPTMPRSALVGNKADTKLTGKPFSSQFVDGCVQGIEKALGPQKSDSFCTCLAREVPKFYTEKELFEHQRRALHGEKMPERLEQVFNACIG